MAPVKRKRLVVSAKKQYMQKSQAFLQYFSADDAKALLKDIEKEKYTEFINEKHVTSSLTLDQIKSATSITAFDGAYFVKWMECKIRRIHVANPPKSHPRIQVEHNSSKYPSIEKKFRTFCTTNSVRCVGVFIHHITLRSINPIFRFLSATDASSEKGSHLCDTVGCILEDHLIIETHEENLSRQACFGVLIQMYEETPGNYFITQMTPCIHGKKVKGDLKEQLKYSRRKIRIIIANNQCVQSFKLIKILGTHEIDRKELPGIDLTSDIQLAVLNSKGQVKGISNLRIVDISIFPKIPGYFPTLPIAIAAEKIAHDIIQATGN